MNAATTSTRPIRVGVITDQTGALSFMGIANANVARMVIDEINAAGGLLGRHLELYLEDSATTDSVAAEKAAKLVREDRVDVVFGGIYSSTRQAIKGPVVEDGNTLYIYPEQYEGQECDPLVFCTGPVPAQQVVIEVPVAVPDGVPPQTQKQIVEIPGYYITETTTGFWYPERWTLYQANAGVYQWMKYPPEFRRKTIVEKRPPARIP